MFSLIGHFNYGHVGRRLTIPLRTKQPGISRDSYSNFLLEENRSHLNFTFCVNRSEKAFSIVCMIRQRRTQNKIKWFVEIVRMCLAVINLLRQKDFVILSRKRAHILFANDLFISRKNINKYLINTD